MKTAPLKSAGAEDPVQFSFWYLNLKPHNLHYSTPSPSHLALVLFPLLIWEFICISEHFNYMQWFYTWIRSREPGWSFFSTLTKVDLGKSCHFQMWKKMPSAMEKNMQFGFFTIQYGNTGCEVFKWGVQNHTDWFLVEMFHNYAFNECISVENLKLWLLILTKTLF